MYTLIYTNYFKKSVKRCVKRGLPMNEFMDVIRLLERDGFLPESYKPHKLVGKHAGKWECHIKPDWLLVWEQNDTALTLIMVDTGSHSDIFG